MTNRFIALILLSALFSLNAEKKEIALARLKNSIAAADHCIAISLLPYIRWSPRDLMQRSIDQFKELNTNLLLALSEQSLRKLARTSIIDKQICCNQILGLYKQYTDLRKTIEARAPIYYALLSLIAATLFQLEYAYRYLGGSMEKMQNGHANTPYAAPVVAPIIEPINPIEFSFEPLAPITYQPAYIPAEPLTPLWPANTWTTASPVEQQVAITDSISKFDAKPFEKHLIFGLWSPDVYAAQSS